MKFALSFEQVASVLIGIDKLSYLKKSLDVANGNYLDNITLAQARKLQYPDPEFLNLPEWEKMGWLT
ncbi:MAG: hypothetical protein ABFS38_13635 [Bacteroidota bacterium]